MSRVFDWMQYYHYWFLPEKVVCFNTRAYNDLQGTTVYFETEAQAWQITNRLSSANASLCGTTWLLGGPGIIGDGGKFSRTFNTSTTHNTLGFSIEVWVLDLNLATNLFNIYFDDIVQSYDSYNFAGYAANAVTPSQICGDSNLDYPGFIVQGKVLHSAAQLTVTIEPLFNSVSAPFSIGFRSLNIILESILDPGTSICQFVPTTDATIQSCFCPVSQYDPAGSGGCIPCSSWCQSCRTSATTFCTGCKYGYSSNGVNCIPCTTGCRQCVNATSTNCLQCIPGYYLYSNRTCKPTCNWPMVIKDDGESYSCHTPCADTTNFLYENGTCLPQCDTSKFRQSSVGSVLFCNFTCTGSQLLYWNSSCYNGCSSPFISNAQGTERYCQLPCNILDAYYPNNTCKATCEWPYVESNDGDYRHCLFTCGDSGYLYWNNTCQSTCPTAFQVLRPFERYCSFYCQGGDYIYWNSTCHSSCSSPLVVTTDSDSNKFCKRPCLSGQYLYPDGTCKSSCNFQTSTSADGVVSCVYPCPMGSYVYPNNICSTTCLTPYVPIAIDPFLAQCNLPCLPNQFYEQKSQTCINQCKSPSVSRIEAGINYCDQSNSTASLGDILGEGSASFVSAVTSIGNILRPTRSNSPFLIALVKLVRYARYINVPIDSNVFQILNSNTSSLYSISTAFYFTMPSNLESKFTKRPLPEAFEQQNLHSSYIVNHWNSMSTYFILCCLGVVCILLEKLINRYKNRTATLIMKRLRTTAKWNFFLSVFLNTYDDLTLFASLEFMSVEFDSAASIISFTVCVCMTCFAVSIMVRILIMSWEAIKIQTQELDKNFVSPDVHFYKKWQNYQVLYAGYKNFSLLKQTYLFWFTLRIIITYLMISFLFNYPLAQTITLACMNVIMMLYLFKVKPLRDPYSYFVSLVYETLLFIVNICLITLAICVSTNRLTPSLEYGLSKTILLVNTAIDACGNLFMWIYLLLNMWYAYRASKVYGLSGKTSWLTFFITAYQSPGVDFSEFAHWENYDSKQKRQKDVRKIQPIKKLSSSSPSIETLFSLRSPASENDSEFTQKTTFKFRKGTSKFFDQRDKTLEADSPSTINFDRSSPDTDKPLNRLNSISKIDVDPESPSRISLKTLKTLSSSPISSSRTRLLETVPLILIKKVQDSPPSLSNLSTSPRKDSDLPVEDQGKAEIPLSRRSKLKDEHLDSAETLSNQGNSTNKNYPEQASPRNGKGFNRFMGRMEDLIRKNRGENDIDMTPSNLNNQGGLKINVEPVEFSNPLNTNYLTSRPRKSLRPRLDSFRKGSDSIDSKQEPDLSHSNVGRSRFFSEQQNNDPQPSPKKNGIGVSFRNLENSQELESPNRNILTRSPRSDIDGPESPPRARTMSVSPKRERSNTNLLKQLFLNGPQFALPDIDSNRNSLTVKAPTEPSAEQVQEETPVKKGIIKPLKQEAEKSVFFY